MIAQIWSHQWPLSGPVSTAEAGGALLDHLEEISPPSPVRIKPEFISSRSQVQSSDFMPRLFFQCNLFLTLYSLPRLMLTGTTAANLADISARVSGMSQAIGY